MSAATHEDDLVLREAQLRLEAAVTEVHRMDAWIRTYHELRTATCPPLSSVRRRGLPTEEDDFRLEPDFAAFR